MGVPTLRTRICLFSYVLKEDKLLLNAIIVCVNSHLNLA